MNKIITFCVLCLVCLLCWCGLSSFQHSRYSSDYNCKDMCRDCEEVFERIGIDTKLVYGHRYDEDDVCHAHTWLLLKTVFGDIEFEATNLRFCGNSAFYHVDDITEGYFDSAIQQRSKGK